MAPAAANSALWADEMEQNVDLELAASSSSGGSSLAAVEEADHGWQTVRYPKRERRNAGKQPKNTPAPVVVGADYDDDEERKAAAAAAPRTAAAAAMNRSSPPREKSDDDEEQAEEQSTKKSKRPKKSKVTLRHAAAQIKDLQLHLYELSSLPPRSQLDKCTQLFKDAFSSIGSGPFYWESASSSKDTFAKAVEAPLQDVPDSVVKTTSDWLSKLPLESLSDYLISALGQLLDLRQNPPMSNKSKAAFAVMISLVLRRKPDALLHVADRLRSGSQFHGPQKLHTLAWAYGQVAKGDVVCGMAIWSQNLLPLAVGSSSTPVSRDVALQFIESLGNDKKVWTSLRSNASRKGDRIVPPVALMSVAYMAFPAASARTKATERFVAIYPFIKDIALTGAIGSKAMKPVAQQLMPLALQAAASDVPELSLEACRLFQWCLAQCRDCYKEWENVHMNNLKASARILAFLGKNWNETASMLAPLASLQGTLRVLRSQNAKAGPENEVEVKKADAQCVLLQKNMTTFPACAKATGTLFGVVAMCFVAYVVSPSVNSWGWDGKIV